MNGPIVRLTRKSGEPIWINAEKIVYYEALGDKSKIVVGQLVTSAAGLGQVIEHAIVVKESPREIGEALRRGGGEVIALEPVGVGAPLRELAGLEGEVE